MKILYFTQGFLIFITSSKTFWIFVWLFFNFSNDYFVTLPHFYFISPEPAPEYFPPYKCFKTLQMFTSHFKNSHWFNSYFHLHRYEKWKSKSQLRKKRKKIKIDKNFLLFKFCSESEDSNGSQRDNGRVEIRKTKKKRRILWIVRYQNCFSCL